MMKRILWVIAALCTAREAWRLLHVPGAPLMVTFLVICAIIMLYQAFATPVWKRRY